MVRRRTTTIGLLATGLIALASGACSILFSTSKEQCATDDDCRARGAGFEGSKCSNDSVCVSSTPVTPPVDAAAPDAVADAAVDPFACAKEPLPNPDPSRKVDLSIRYTDFTNGTPPTRTIVRLCAQTDALCNNPRNTLEGNGTADAGPDGGTGFVNPKVDGTVTAKVEYGFEGFFELKSADYLPTYRYTSPPLRASASFEQLVLRLSEVNFLSDTALGKPNSFDSVGHGVVFTFARDCNNQPLAGVSFTTTAQDPLLTLAYIINTTPSIVDKQTDALGRGGYLNVPPGLHTFTSEFAATKQRIGSARVLVRAGAATTVAILPSP
jgi:hypothetical protein